jgi:hypothetical protein
MLFKRLKAGRKMEEENGWRVLKLEETSVSGRGR